MRRLFFSSLDRPSLSCLIISGMLILLPATGATTDSLLQDTLKSIIASFLILIAVTTRIYEKNNQKEIIIHPLIILPTLLAGHALFSMYWSHTYLAGIEFSRWFIFGMFFLIGSKTINQKNFKLIAWSIHLGAFIASTWIALQFWFDFQFFAQGPNPASTFVNRNFFAEFLVCTIPFSLFICLQTKETITASLLAISLGFNTIALAMTGTRSALIAVIFLFLFMPYPLWKNRSFLEARLWTKKSLFFLILLLAISMFFIGSIKTQNANLISEFGRSTAFERAITRTNTLLSNDAYTKGSLSVRASMWKDTLKMILANPFFGVGAGAWEVDAPLYQDAGRILETDYYAHNEILQLIAEYGIVGWLFLATLFYYLAKITCKVSICTEQKSDKENPLRITALSSLIALMIVSNAGFPWRLATTGVFFMLCLSILAASDLRLNLYSKKTITIAHWNNFRKNLALIFTSILVICAAYISYQAIQVERKLVSAIKIGMTISHSKDPNSSRWMSEKEKMLSLVHEGIAINPHYRKLTPIVADSLASWGDWENAIWIWKSVLSSRPNITAITANIAKGYLAIGDYSNARLYIERARKIQPDARIVSYLDILLLSSTGRSHDAEERAEALLDRGWQDKDFLQIAYSLGKKSNNIELLIKTLEAGIAFWPEKAVDGWLKLGDIYANHPLKMDTTKALECYQSAFQIAPPEYRDAVFSMIPNTFQVSLRRE